MTDFVTLACPSCGAALSVHPDAVSLKCDYCGNEHLVRKQGKEILLEHSSVWLCPRCGNPASVGTGFCPKCGFALTRNCPQCKHRIFIGAIFCPECGINIKEAEQQNLIKQAAKKQRCGQIEDEISSLSKEITQAKKQMPKMSGGWLIILLVLGSTIFGCYAISLALENADQNSSAILFGFLAVALFVIVLFIIGNRNRVYKKYKQIEEIYDNKRKRIIELQKEYTSLMSHGPNQQ